MSDIIVRAVAGQICKELAPLWEQEVKPELNKLREFIRAEIKIAVAEAVRDLHEKEKL